MIGDDFTDDWGLYQKGIDYNSKINLYKNVDQNEAFYSGDQWRGVQANGLPTPVFNILKTCIRYFIASILSQKTKMQFSVDNIPDDTQDEREKELLQVTDMLSKHTDLKWEKLKIETLLRDGLLDSALSGDMVLYTYWDDTIETGQTYGTTPQTDENGNVIQVPTKIKGDFVTELFDNVNVFPGNPNMADTQKQPYIILLGRALVSDLKAEAKKNNVSQQDISKIEADTDTAYQSGDRGKIELDDSKKCNYVIKLWRDQNTGHIFKRKSTKYVVIEKDTDTELHRYPVNLMNWEKRKNSFHGQAAATELIPNQIYINKQFAMIMKHLIDTAFGKIVYDSSLIPEWTNRVGEAIPMVGGGKVSEAVYAVPVAQLNNAVFEAVNTTIDLTKQLVGANDAALGNVNPENTSAIIALQQASAIPLENQKQNLYSCVEDLGLTWLDFMLHKYKVPRTLSYQDNGVTKIFEFNPNDYQDVLFNLKIDVGPSQYWSEITSMQTLDNLLKDNFIDFVAYLERVPNGIIPKKQELIDQIKAQMKAQLPPTTTPTDDTQAGDTQQIDPMQAIQSMGSNNQGGTM